MSDRVVSVRLQARVEGFTAGMTKAKASVDELTKAAAPNKAQAFEKLADRAALAGVGIATAVGVAVKRFADFDQAMSAVKANSGATGAELESLRASAIKLGAASQFSATEAAQGINELSKAGVKAGDILSGGLKGSLDLAAAGQISVADAAETAATAMTQFGLSGDKVPHIADLLANAANKAQGGVGDMALALKQAGLVAASTGLSIEETTAGLTAFASAGLIGSDAGTSFKTMLQRLSAPTADAQKAMNQLGISAYDSQGNFIGLANVAEQLKTGLSKLTPEQRNSALATIFGSDAIRAANVLYDQGAAGINKWTKEVSEQGAAAKQAATLTDNLKGDVERLGGALDAVFIQTGSGANGGLRTLVQDITGLVGAVSSVPGPLLLAAGGLASFALLAPKGVSKYREYVGQLDELGVSMDKISAKSPRAGKALEGAGRAAKGFGTALAAAAAVDVLFLDEDSLPIQGLTKKLLESKDAASAFNDSIVKLDTGSKSLGETIGTALDPSWFDEFQHKGNDFTKLLTLGMADLGEPLGIAEKRLAELDQVLSGLVSSGNGQEAARILDQIAASSLPPGKNIDDLKSKLPGYSEALAGVSNQSTLAAAGQGKLTDTTGDLQGAAEKARQALDELKGAIEGLGSPVAQQRAATNDYEAAIDNATSGLVDQKDALVKARLESLGITDATRKQQAAAEAWAVAQMNTTNLLDAGTEAGRTNRANLDQIQSSTLAKVAADYELAESTKGTAAATRIATETMRNGRQAYIDAAVAAGMTKTQAGKLADQLGLIPEQVAIQVSQKGAEGAGAAIDAAARDRSATIWVNRKDGGLRRLTDLSETFQGVGGRASGGLIYGAGTKTSDDVPIWASRGEFMQKAAAVDKYGTDFMHAVNSLRFPAHLARGYRDGGEVGQSRFAPLHLTMGSSSAAAAGDSGFGRQFLSGSLDLGDGLQGYVRAIATDERTQSQRHHAFRGQDA